MNGIAGSVGRAFAERVAAMEKQPALAATS
jgi:hypothetical protein